MAQGKARSRAATISQLQAELALLTRTSDHLARRSDLYTDMERSWYVIALILESAGELSINELAASVALDSTTITRQVTAMSGAGIVERKTGPEDGRTRIVSLSPRGVELMRNVRDERIRRYKETLADWSDDELESLATLTMKFNRSVSGGADTYSYLAPAPTRRKASPAQSSTSRRGSP